MNPISSATIIAALVFIASVVSVEAAVAAAIIETTAGIVAGNVLGLHSAPWMDFLAGFGGILLTFLAGAEVDPDMMRAKLKENLLIGGCSFLAPYLAAIAYCFWVAHWSWDASLIAGCTLSTTSLAVVYAVLVETGLTKSPTGKIIMASTFVSNIGTALALSLSFSEGGPRTFLFLAISAVLIIIVPRIAPRIFDRYGARVIEPEIKFLFLLLFGFMALAHWGASHAILPVFVLGLALARMFRRRPDLQRKLRIVAFAMITPFFFIKGGMNVSLTDVAANWPLVAILFGIKAGAKFIGVWPLAKLYSEGHPWYTSLLMSTGLTFGTISALYGLQAGFITPSQFSILIAVVILSAIVPTVIAQRWCSPTLPAELREELQAQEEEAL